MTEEDSYIRDDTDNEPLQRKQDKGQASLAMVLLQGAVEADGSWQKESQDKERFLPPTGGCFRHQSPHSRLGSLAAQILEVVQSKSDQQVRCLLIS